MALLLGVCCCWVSSLLLRWVGELLSARLLLECASASLGLAIANGRAPGGGCQRRSQLVLYANELKLEPSPIASTMPLFFPSTSG